jgi:hypothetical protein
MVLCRATSRPRVYRRGVEFSDEICFRLSREIITFVDSGVESTCSRQGQVKLDIHDGLTWFVRLQKTDQKKLYHSNTLIA